MGVGLGGGKRGRCNGHRGRHISCGATPVPWCRALSWWWCRSRDIRACAHQGYRRLARRGPGTDVRRKHLKIHEESVREHVCGCVFITHEARDHVLRPATTCRLACRVASTASFFHCGLGISCVIFCAFVDLVFYLLECLSSLERISLPQVNTTLLSARRSLRTWLWVCGFAFAVWFDLRRQLECLCVSMHNTS